MRKINMKDVFLASKIARKINFKNAGIDFKANQEEVGGQIIIFIFENLDKAQDEICELFGGILEIDPNQFLEMSLDEIYNKFKEMEGLKDFFTSLSKLTTSKSTTSFSSDIQILNSSMG